jgi:parallel beta-helix repeat protein
VAVAVGFLLALAAPSFALGEIRLVAGSDTPGANYADVSVLAGDTIILELWVESDTRFNGFSAYMTYGGQGLRLREAADASDSFPTANAGIQADEDHAALGDVLLNRGQWTGASTDTFQYVALTGADSVLGAFRAASLYFTAETAGTYTIDYVFNTGANQITALTAANGLGADQLTTDDSGVVTVTIIDTRLPNVWYLNDTSRTGDSFTFAVGADTANGLTRATPKRTWAAIRPFVTAGDSIYVDAGTWYETFVIDTDNISVIGADSALTIVDGSMNATAWDTAIAVTGRNGVRIESIGVSNGSAGIVLENADSVVIRSVRAVGAAQDGVRLVNADSVLIERYWVSGGASWGLRVNGTDRGVIRNSRFENSVSFEEGSDTFLFESNAILATGGVFVDSGIGHVMRYNVSTNAPWTVSNASFLTIAENTSNSAGGSIGFTIDANASVISGNTASSNFAGGYQFGGTGNTITSNTASGNTNVGIRFGALTQSTVSGNSSTGNTSHGFWLYSRADTNMIADNRSLSNGLSGFVVSASSGNRLERNIARANNDIGLYLNGDTGTVVEAGQFDSNTVQQVRVDNGSSGSSIRKSLLLAGSARPDSIAFVVSPAALTVTRSWWGRTDTDAIKRAIWGPGRDQVIYVPFRLGTLDTTAGADTVAPRAPDTVAGYGLTDTALRVTWSATTASEEAEGAVGLAGYRIYRSPVADTSVWILVGQSATTGFTDSGLNTNETRYYRVTAFDGAGVENQSFYSDSIVAIGTLHETQPPADFTLLLPVAGTETQALTLTFRWSNSSDSSPTLSYRLIIDTDMAGASIVDTTIPDTDAVLTLAANDTYLWRVIALDTYGTTRTVGDSVFVLDTASPNVGAPSTPAASHETSATTIAFTWTAGSDTHSGVRDYRLQIDTSGAFTAPLVDSLTPLTSGTRTLAPNDTYYWRLITIDDAGNTSASSSRFVVVDTSTPAPISAIYPVALSETNAASVGFSWTASADTGTGLAAYRLQIDTAGTFAGTLAADSDVAAASIDTAIAVGEGTWYWRVLARDDAGNTSAYTTPLRFVVDRTAPIIFAVTISPSASLFFTDSGGIDTTAAADTVYFNNGGGGAGQIDTVVVTATGADSINFPLRFGDGPLNDAVAPYLFGYSIELGHGDTTMIITARDTAGNSDSVTVVWARDTVAPPLVGLVNPADSQVTGDTTPSLSWASSADSGAGTRSYVIEIANSMSFGTLIESSVATGLSYTSAGLADSIYFWRVIPQDSVSNADTASASIRMFRIDSGVPAITALSVISTASTYFFDDTPVVAGLTPDTVYFNPTGAGANQVCTITVTVSDINETRVVGTSAFVPILLDDSGLNRDTYTLAYRIPQDSGTATITIVATDATGFTDTALVRFEADTLAPTTPALAAPATPHDTTATTITFSWTASTDTGAGVSGYRLQIDTVGAFAAPFVDSATGLALTATRSLAANDTYYWRVVVADNVANSVASSTSALRVDTQAPTVGALSAPATNHDTTAVTIAFGWTAATDTGAGVASYRLQIDTANTFATLLVDSSTGSLLTGIRTLAANDTYYWRVVTADNAGNTSAYSSNRLRVDTAAPTSAVLVQKFGDTGPAPVTLAWSPSSDAITGLKFYIVQVDTTGTFTALMESTTIAAGDTDHVSALVSSDTYFWRVLAYDSIGNFSVSTPASDTFRIPLIDTTPPGAFSATAPADLHETNAVSFLLRWSSAADSNPPVRYRVQIDTTGAFVSNVVDTQELLDTFLLVTLPANDTYTWRVIARDNVGNTAAIAAAFRVVVDTAPPIGLSASAPSNPTDTLLTTISFAWTAASDTGSGLSGYRLQIDTAGTFASLLVDSSSGTIASGSRTLAANDTYFWRVLATDDAGNTAATAARTLRVDTGAPTIAILTAPATNTDTSATAIIFTWSPSLDSVTAIASYRLQIDTSGAFALPLVDSSTGTLTTGARTLAANDTYYWRVVTADNAGNTVASSANLLRIDVIAPTVSTLTTPASGFDTRFGVIAFTWSSSTDTGTGIASYRLEIDTAGTFTTLVDSSTGAATAMTRSLTANDTYYWRVITADNAGNTVASASRLFRVDSLPPSPPILIARNGETLIAAPTLAWVAALDTISGLAYYNVQLDTAGTFASISESVAIPAGDTDHVPTTLSSADTYFWRVIAYDSAGNAKTSAPSVDSFRLLASDTTPPGAFSLTYPPDLHETRATTFLLRWSDALDSSAPVRYRVQIDTAGTFLASVVDTQGLIDTFFAASVPANDTYTWRVIASDNSGNTTVVAVTRRFVVDTAGPTGLAASSPADPTDTLSTTITFAWTTASDSGTGFSGYRLQIDTSGTFAVPLVDSSMGILTTGPRTLAANDTYYWRILATDDAGNTTATIARTLRVDTGSPTSAVLTAPATNADTSATTITFAWAASLDSITAIASYRLQIDTSGAFTLPLVDSSTGTLTTGARTLPANDTYYWRVVTADNAGNTVASSANLLRIDAIAPTVVSLTSPASGFDTRFGVIAFAWSTSSDTGTGVASYRLEIDTAGTFTTLVDSSTGAATAATRSLTPSDTYYWRVVTADNAGNTVASSSRFFRVDSLPPSPPILIARNGETLAAVPTLAWVAALDTISGLAYYNVQIDTAGTFASIRESVAIPAGDTDHAPTTLSSADTYYWRVIAYDTAGNAKTSSLGVDSFRLLVTDTTPPGAFSLSYPPDLHETRATTFLLRWTDSLDSSTPVRYRVQVDSAGTFTASVVDTQGLIDTFFAATIPANDTYTWRVIASDNSGNTTVVAVTRRFVVDTAGPTGLAASAPADPTDTNATTVTFSWTAGSDTGTGLGGYRLQVDTVGNFLAPFVDSVTTIVSSASRALPPNDTYYWRLVAVDDVGNTTTVAARTLRVDTGSPTVAALTAPGAGTDTTATTITFFWTSSSDTGTGVSGYRLQIDTSGSFTSPLVDSSTPALTASRTLAADDTYFWRVVSVDNAGNTVAASPTFFRIDTLGPTAVALSAPADLHDTTATTIAFSWSAATDTGTGVAGYRLQVDTNSTFAAPLVDSSTGTSITGTRTLNPNDTYYWRVVAADNAGNTTASTSRRVRIDTAPPTTPILTTIAGDSRTAPVTLTWSTVADSITSPRSFVIQIDTAGTFAALVESATQAVADTDYLTGMLSFETHFWRVLAYDTLGNVSISATDSFVVRVGDTIPPSAFNLTSPTNDSLSAAATIIFRWQNSLDDSSPPVRYRLQIDTAGSFVAPVTDTSWLADTFVTVTLAANDTYYWRVIARDNSLNTTASTVTSTPAARFAIDTAPPSAPKLFTYKGDTTQTPPVYLRWTASTDSIAGVGRYLLQLDTTVTFTLPLNDSVYLNVPDTDHFTGVLTPDTYYWRVYAFDSVGNSAVSSIDSFVIRIPDTIAPTILSASASPSSVSNAGTTTVTFTVFARDSGYVASVIIHLAGVGGVDSQAFTPATAVPSSDSRWTLTHVFDTTVAGGVYPLTITAIDASNNRSTTTVSVTVADTSPSLSLLVDTPLANIRAGGNELSIVSTYGDTYATVHYQFRAVPAGPWMTCTPSAMSVDNPDTQGPFWGFYWDISGLPDSTQYDVRAVGTDNFGVTDPSPGFIRITVDARDSNVNEYRSTTTSLHIRRQQVRSDTLAQIMIAEGTVLDLPSGAVADSVWIRVTVHDTAPATTPVASIFVVPGNGTFREFIREDGARAFSGLLTLTLPYADTDALNDNVGQTTVKEADLAIYHFDAVVGSWVKENTSKVDPVRNVVTASIDHFTIFAVLAGAAAAADLQGVVVYPNPFVPYDGVDKNGKPYSAADPTSGILFDSLPTQVTIDVYDIAGRRVATMSKASAFARYQWDAHSDDGREIASGVYIAIIRSTTGEQIVRKIMVIR